MSGLVRSTSSTRLSGCTVELRMSGRWPSSVKQRRDRKRVSKWNRPAGLCSTSTTSPNSSNMAKLSPSLSVRRLEAASETTPGTMTGPEPGSFSRFMRSGKQWPRERPVDFQVVLRHAKDREARLEAAAHLRAVERHQRGDLCHRGIERIDDIPGQAVFDHLGHGAVPPGEHGGAAGHGLDHGEAERLGPVDGKKERRRIAEKGGLVLLGELADELDRPAEQRCNAAAEVRLVHRVDLGGDAQRDPGAARDLDGALQSLLGRDPSEEGEIAALRRHGARAYARRKSVVYRRQPVLARRRPALTVGNGH